MPSIPVICDSCGCFWQTENLIGVRGSQPVQVTLSNVSVAPCPACGAAGHVPDGVYELTNSTTALRRLSVDELRRLLDVARLAADATLDADAVAARISDSVPAASGLGAQLTGQTSLAVAAWLSVLIAVLTLLIPLAERKREPLTEQQVQRAMVTALQNVGAKNLPTKLGRNERCHCGSGKKFKHCHGR